MSRNNPQPAPPAWTNPADKNALESGWEYCRIRVEIFGDPSQGLFTIRTLHYSREGSRSGGPLEPESWPGFQRLRATMTSEGWEEVLVPGNDYYFRRRQPT
jgi:hypothetical protein